MGMQTDIMEHVTLITEDMKLRQEEEERETIEKEIYDIHLELAFNESIWVILIAVFAMCFVLFLKILAKPVLKCILYHEALKISGSLVVGIVVLAIFVVGAVLLLVYYKTRKNPTVQGSSLIYRGKRYHYSQISKIKISSIFVAKVFVDDKKLFWVSRDFTNYDAFICWAGKCRIPIEESEPLTEKDVTMITVWVVLGCMLLSVAVYVAGAILGNG